MLHINSRCKSSAYYLPFYRFILSPCNADCCTYLRSDITLINEDVCNACMLSVTMLGPIRQDAIKEPPVTQVKKTAMVFKVHSRHVDFLLTYCCS